MVQWKSSRSDRKEGKLAPEHTPGPKVRQIKKGKRHTGLLESYLWNVGCPKCRSGRVKIESYLRTCRVCGMYLSRAEKQTENMLTVVAMSCMTNCLDHYSIFGILWLYWSGDI